MINGLDKLKKKELIEIISNFKKEELVKIINNKVGGENNNNVVRTPIKFNKNKLNKIVNNAMANDKLYNHVNHNI
jgi:hypothetical protein